MTKVLTYVEIDVDFCANVFGEAPCTATGSGDSKCYNSISTCQDRTNFSNDPVTLRFALDCGFLPTNIESIPSLQSVSYTPSEVSLGENLGVRASLAATFRDHPHSDTGPGYDPYRSERSYDPYSQGTFWGKMRARQPYLRGRAIRLIRGTVGQAISEMTTYHFLIEDFDGPSSDGTYRIVAKDVLKLADGDRAQAPDLSDGYLGSELTAGTTSFTIYPTGIGDTQYPSSGYIAIGGEEICSFTRTGDSFTIVRAQKGTTDVGHETSDRVQLCLDYSGESPADIIYDLLTTYAGVPASYINLEDWQTECDNYLQRLYSATIADPVSVKILLSELVEQAALALWWSAEEQSIKLQVLRQIVSSETFDETNIIENSLKIKEQPQKRKTEVWTYYGMRNPLEGVDDPANYRSTLATVDLQTESDYGAASIKKIFARWIPAFGLEIAERVNAIQIARYQEPPRAFQFDVHRFGDVVPTLGSGYNIEHWTLQDASGARDTIPIQVIKLEPGETAARVFAEEASMETPEDSDLYHRVITIDTDYNNFNLRTIHDNLYPPPEGGSPTVDVTCIINSGVIVGSTSAGTPAFSVGEWPDGVPLTLIIHGRIQGAGGTGGDGCLLGVPDPDGGPGGTAFYTREQITIDIRSTGQIWGGGGGGGGGDGWAFFSVLSAAGGGGGQGRVGGAGGIHLEGQSGTAEDGNPGTSEAPGTAGAVNGGVSGGDGGGPGEAGDNGSGSSGGTGGAAGAAIDGKEYVLLDGGSPGVEIIGELI